MEWIRVALGYVALIAGLIGLAWGVQVSPSCSHAVAPFDYHDMFEVPPYADVSYDGTIKIHQLQVGDKIVFTLGDEGSTEKLFGWVGGLPGDEVSIENRQVFVNGSNLREKVKPDRALKGSIYDLDIKIPDHYGLTIPANHIYLISDKHEFDSSQRGPVPALALLGRITEVVPRVD